MQHDTKGPTVSWVLALAALAGLTGPTEAAPSEPETREYLSPVYTVDRKYRSMTGPQATESLVLVDGSAPELLWITGYEAVMVGSDGTAPMPQDFMCHSNLDLDPSAHGELFRNRKSISSRLFTLSQGQLSIEFPPGFAIPVLSTEDLSLTTQVLNLNLEGDTVEVRHKVTVDFIRDRDLDAPMKPLFASGVYGLASLEGAAGYFGLDEDEVDPEEHGPGCLPGLNADTHEYEDVKGRRFTGHWVVKPGREVNRTLVTEILNLPFDTTAHYIAIHLHPFAESLELRDLTTGETVFKSRARQFEDRIGLAHVDYFSSPDGLPLYRDHEYELISVYNNTTDEDQDSMAVMNLYLLDKEFKNPLE